MTALNSYPFDRLRLPIGEVLLWHTHNPTFHRGADYGIVLTLNAVYLYSPFWRCWARWRRIPMHDIQSVAFRETWLVPSLRIQTRRGVAVLRTPWDYTVLMDEDRENLQDAVARISDLLRLLRSRPDLPISSSEIRE